MLARQSIRNVGITRAVMMRNTASFSTTKPMPVVAPDAKLTPEVIATIKATAPVVAQHVVTITSGFYKKMFTRNPEVLRYFNKNHQRNGSQPQTLANAVVAYALNIDNLGVLGDAVARMAHRHCALSITPEMYPIVHENLMMSVGEVLGDAVTPEIANAWSTSVLVLANILVEAEEKLYREGESRVGGWRLEKELLVTDKKLISNNVVSLRFKREDYNGPYEFTAGQYLTLRHKNNMDAPRHYTLTSAPGDDFLEVSVRRVDKGLMSNFLHDDLKVGDKLKAGAPFGVYTPHENAKKNVLISGGIGITPMVAFAKHFGKDRIAGVYHVEKEKASHAFADYFQKFGAPSKITYTKDAGEPNLESDMKELVKQYGTDASYYVCAPEGFIQACEYSLEGAGCKNVFSEKFGTGVVPKRK